jgi:hypothetical protein
MTTATHPATPPANPTQGVFTSLIETLGVQDVQFEELISLDAETIRSLGYVLTVLPIIL